MKRPTFLKSAPALAVILALASTSAYGATNVRGGPTSTDIKASSQGTAAQSAKQEGSVQANSSSEGAARRARSGSFASKAVDAIKKVISPTVIVENAVTNEDRELTAHLADAEAFIRKTGKEGFLALSMESSFLAMSVKSLILYGTQSVQKKKMQALVEELAKTDEEALHSLFILGSYRFAATVKSDKPEFTAGLDRIEARLKADGFTRPDSDGVNWHLDPDVAPAILAAPGARALLHKLTDSEAQQNAREALAMQRASILNVAKAQQSIERMQALKTYIKSMYKKAGVEVLSPAYFMNELQGFSSATANGGVILVFKESPYPVEIHTAHGVISYQYSTMTKGRAWDFHAKYIEDLGLELLQEYSGTHYTSGYKIYAVTRLPDGTKIPKASIVEVPPVSAKEIDQLVSQVPEKVRKGIKVKVGAKEDYN